MKQLKLFQRRILDTKYFRNRKIYCIKFSFPTGAAGELKGQQLEATGGQQNKKRESYEDDADYVPPTNKGKENLPPPSAAPKNRRKGGTGTRKGRPAKGKENAGDASSAADPQSKINGPIQKPRGRSTATRAKKADNAKQVFCKICSNNFNVFNLSSPFCYNFFHKSIVIL